MEKKRNIELIEYTEVISVEQSPSRRVILEMNSDFGTQEQHRAQLVQKGKHWFISFQDEQGSSLLKIGEEEITVIRRGQVTMRQSFRKGVLTSGTFTNPAGKMVMETHTHEIVFEMDSHGQFRGAMWRYDLRLNGQEIGQNRITCTIHPIQGLEE
jgi:uncharacterized beta-barrel protein YwiB (DUF1934 family)